MSTLKLYYSPYTRSTRPMWLIAELGLDVELVRVDLRAGEHKGEAHLSRHPLGRVPALEVDGEWLTESAAICVFLAEQAGKLLPPVGTLARGRVHEALFWAMSEVEPHLLVVFRAARNPPADEAGQAALQDAKDKAEAVFRACPPRGTWYLGDDFTVADVVVASVGDWAMRMGLLAEQPLWRDYVARCTSRPAFSATKVTS